MVIWMDKELKLTTKRLLMLERKIGKNPIDIFTGMQYDRMPMLTDIITIMQCAIGDITESGVTDLYDKWREKGNTLMDIIPIIEELYTDAGLIGAVEVDENPN